MKHDADKPLRRLSALAAMVLLAACAGVSPPVRYYALDAPAPRGPVASAGPVMVVGPIAMPEYLQRPQLIRRSPGAELEVDDLHRWAEPLDDAVPRVLVQNLNALAVDVTATPAPARGVDPDLRLSAAVLRFEADAAGNVALLVQWSIADRAGNRTVALRTDHYHSPARSGEPGAIAAAMSELLTRFAGDIAGALAGR